jgi:multidrug efflux pump subunit AcrA (membrane-fusion protein)
LGDRSAEIAVSVDSQAGQLVVLAPPSVHEQVSRLLSAPAGEVVARPADAVRQTDLTPAEQFVPVARAQIEAIQSELKAMCGSRLTVPLAASRSGRMEYRFVDLRGRRVDVIVDRSRDGFLLVGNGSLVGQFARLIRALDAAQTDGTGVRVVVIDLNVADAALLAPGAAFVAYLVAAPDVSARAALDRIDPVAEKSTRTRRAHLRLETPPDAFRLGALAHVVRAPTADAAFVVPETAVLDSGEGPAVWVVDRGQNVVRRRPIALGARIGGYVIVTSGLSAGDEIVTRGIHSLHDGQPVGPRIPQ